MAVRRLPKTTASEQPRCFGYCRVSTEQQADSGIGLDEQRRKIEARAAEMNWRLEHVYTDAGVSGSTPLGKRSEGAKLLAALKPGDVVVAARMDRCFRSALDALQTITEFRAKRISLWLLDLGDVSGNGISELTVTILAAVAQFERSLISERIKDAKRNLRRAGRHQGGSLPFGYRRGDANHLIAEPSEQAAISTIRQMREAGASLMTIRDAVRAKGLAISHETVRRVLVRSVVETAGHRHQCHQDRRVGAGAAVR